MEIKVRAPPATVPSLRGSLLCGIAVFLTLAATSRRPAAAQSQATDAEHRHAALAKVSPGRQVMVAVPVSGRVRGALSRVDDSTLALQVDSAGMVRIPLIGVDTLWVRGRAAKTGAILGAIPGALFLGASAGLLCEIAKGDGSTCSTAALTAGGVVAGGIGGAIVGGLVGAAIPKWHRRFASQTGAVAPRP